MFKLAVFSVLLAVAIAKPSVYYSAPLAYSAPVVAAPSSVSSHSKTDYHNENSHSVVGGGVAAVAADPVVASVGAVPDPSTVQQYPTEIHSAPVVALPLTSFSNYSRTDSSNEYSETGVDPAVPSASSLVFEQLPVVEIKSQNYVTIVPGIVVSSSPSPVSLEYLPPVSHNVVPNVYINNRASASDEIIPEISTVKSVVVPSSTLINPLSITEFLPTSPEITGRSSKSITVNEVSVENSTLDETVATSTVTVVEDSEVDQTTPTVSITVTEGDDDTTVETANVTSDASLNTSPTIVPVFKSELNVNVPQSSVNEVVVNSFVSNQPLRPLQKIQSNIEDRSGDDSLLVVQAPKAVVSDFNLPSVQVSYASQPADSVEFISSSLVDNGSKDSALLVQTPKTAITDYNVAQEGPSIVISYISDKEPLNASVRSFPATFIDSYTEVEKQEVRSPHVSFDLVSRASPVPSVAGYNVAVESVSEPSKVLVSPDYVFNSPGLVVPQVSQYTNFVSSTPLPTVQNVEVNSKIDADVANLRGSLEQRFPDVVSVDAGNPVVNIVPSGKDITSKVNVDVANLKESPEQRFPDTVSVDADNSVVNIVPSGKDITSKVVADIKNLKESLEQTFPNVVSVEADNSEVDVASVQVPALSVVSTVPSIISSTKTDFGQEVSQHWIGTPATPIQSVQYILSPSPAQPLVSLKTFNSINSSDERLQSVTPFVGNVDPTLLSYASIPISVPISSSSYNKTDYSNETSFTITPLGTVASNVADSSFGPASVAYSSPVEVAPGSSVSSSSRTDYHHEASRSDVGAGAVAVSQPVVAAYSGAPVAYSSAPVAVAGSPASSVSSHTKTDYHHENSHNAVGPGASVAAVRASPVVYSAAAPVAYSAAPVAIAASPASSVSSHTKTDYHHEDSRHQIGAGAAVAAVRSSPVAYSAPAVAYSAPAVAYSAPAVTYSAPAVTYSAPAVSYSSPSYVVRKVAVAAPSYYNDISYTPAVYARRVYSSPAVAYASSPYVSYSSPVAYAAGPASSSSSSIRTGGYHHEDHQQNVY